MSMKKFILIFIGLAGPFLLHAQPLSVSLKEAKALAIEQGYAMMNANMDIEATRREVKEVLAIGLPQISANVEYQQFLQIPVSLIPGAFVGLAEGEFAEVQFGVEYNLTGNITASQLLFDGTYLVGLKAAKTAVELTQNARIKTAAEVRVAVADAYYTSLVAEANKTILEKNLKSVNDLLAESEALYENGLLEEQDVDQLRLNRNQIQNSIDNTLKYLDIALKSLNFIMGVPIDQEVLLTDKIEDLVALNNNVALLERDYQMESHPDMLIARTNVMVQDLTLQGAKAAYYPSLNLFLSHQQNAQRNGFNFTDGGQPWFPSTILGVNMNIPIFSSFKRENNVKRSEIKLDKAELNLVQARENLQLNQTRAIAAYENAMRVWNTQKQSMELAERINERTGIKYKEGIATSTELNVARTQLLSEQGRYIDAALQLLNAKQELDKAFNLFED
jgi:outer membrane protein TolC